MDKRGNRTQALECLAHPTTTTDTTIAYNDKGLFLKGTWSEVSGFNESSDFGASLKIMFLGENRKHAMGVLGDNLTLTMGTGPDHSIYDLYVGGSLWQSFDGYAATAGQVDIKLEVHGDGPHLLEIRNRPERNTASTDFKVRFKQLVILDRTYDLHTIEYIYDALSRLREARYNPNLNTNAADADLLRRYQYAFDLAGNRTQQIVTVAGTPTTTNYTYNAANQLVSDGTNTLTFDNNGNLTDDGPNTYVWDRANRLGSMGGASYKYDGLGRRVQQTAGTDITKYLLDVQPGLSLVIGGNLNGNMTRYIHSPMGIHAQENASGVWTWTVQDGLGNVRLEADNALVVQAMRNTTPYLEQWGEQGTFAMPFAMTGELTDFNRGLVHLRARDYALRLGVFPSLDPFEGMMNRPMSLNGYSWVEGSVPNLGDPSGYAPLCQSAADCACFADNKVLFDLCQAYGNPSCPKQQVISSCNVLSSIGKFSLSDNDLVYAIAIAVFGEGRFAGQEGIQIEAAAAINKLRAGNQLSSFGSDYGAALIGLTGHCGGYEDTSNSLGVRTSCINDMVTGIISGKYTGGGAGEGYPNSTAMAHAVSAVRSLLRRICGEVSETFTPKVEHVLSDINLRLALTFDASWADDLDTLKCCMEVDKRRDANGVSYM